MNARTKAALRAYSETEEAIRDKRRDDSVRDARLIGTLDGLAFCIANALEHNDNSGALRLAGEMSRLIDAYKTESDRADVVLAMSASDDDEPPRFI